MLERLKMKQLKYIFLVLIALLVVKFGCCQTCTNLDASVIIIGAGMSGMSAANRLHENGTNNILILEALPRTGGRVANVEVDGVNVSIGATLIQGIDPTNPTLHPLYELAERCGGLDGVYHDYDSQTDYDSQGSTNFTGSKTLRYDDYDVAFERAQELALQLQQVQGCTNASIRYGLTAGNWTPMTPEDMWIDWYNHDFCVGEPPESSSLCEAITNIDTTYTRFLSANTTEGEDYFVTDREGFQKLITCMARGIFEQRGNQLHLNSTVTVIDWSNEECVCVQASENGQHNKYCALYAISTLSVGVLQNETVQFVPQLPDMKMEAIGKFKMANYINIIMEFSEVFWDATEFIAHIHNDRGYYPIFINFNLVDSRNPKILAAVLTGSNADRVARQPLANTISEIRQVLESIYPGRNVTPTNVIVPDWDVNPLFYGSFSDAPVGLTHDDYGKLAAPIGNLYFSGEATSREYYGFLHGAYFAGIDTADEIIRRGFPASSASSIQISTSIIMILCAIVNLV